MNTFFEKNDIGVSIEYTIIGIINEEDKKYMLYTDFVPENNEVGFRVFVDEIVDGNITRLDKDSANKIIETFNKEIFDFKNYERN